MKYNYIILSIVCLSLSSCKTLKKATSTTQNIEVNVNQYPTVVDLNVAQDKVEKTITWNYSLFKFFQPSYADRRDNLIADIVKENGADVLLEVQSTFQKVPFGQRTLTITGYPATYKNFRKAGKEDLRALEIMQEKTVTKKHQATRKGFVQKIFSR